MMIKRFTITLLLASLALFIVGCNSNGAGTAETKEKTPLIISAAVSLTDALEEIKTIYEEDHAVELTFTFGGSGSLAQQIQQGAPADAFISANQDWMDTLEGEDLIIPETRVDITGNKLVLITGKSSTINYQSLADISADDVSQIAVGNPESVPAGQYTEQALQSLQKWDALKDKIVYGKDVRQVLTYVETGNTDIGFVYESDALSSDAIQILLTVEDGLHDPVIYPAAVIADTKHEKEAKAFVSFLETDQAQEILAKHGFKK